MPRSEMKRTGFFKGMLDGLRSSVSQPVKLETEIEESLRPEHFRVAKSVRHGFPYQPTAIAFDPVQRLLAIGSKNGSLRLFGRPGVDCHVQHVLEAAVIQILFLINEGALITVCSDDSLHLWNLRQKAPEIVHTLKFQKERITYCYMAFQSKWLYIGTERGNIHVVNVESFVLSGYVINWNKAIELSRKTHPGAVIHLSDNPADPNKLLIGFETGAIVLWDLRNRAAEMRFQSSETLRSISWHHEGKQMMGSHGDGSLTTWNVKVPGKPVSVIFPHAKPNKDGKMEPCKTIYKVEWKTVRGGDSFVVFSGGLPFDKGGKTPSLTVVHGKTTTVLEMEHDIIDFITLCETPWQSDFHEPYAIVVLLYNDLVVVDLTCQGYPCFQNPYPMDLHESPVTYCRYLADCPTDLIPAFYSAGSKTSKRSGFSEKEWPINGGEWGTSTVSYPEVIITGHADGSLKFWDASAVSLQVLCKLKTAKLFEKPKGKSGVEEDPFAIEQVAFCPESRLLAVAGASSQVILYRFSKHESTVEVPALEIPIVYEIDDEPDCSPECEYPPRPNPGLASQQGSLSSASDEGTKKCTPDYYFPLRVKSSPIKRGPGFQASFVCLTPWIDGEPPGHITSIGVNSAYSLLAYGNECGLAVVDLLHKTCLLNMGTPDLYGSSDPYQRVPRSPKRNNENNNNNNGAAAAASSTADLMTASDRCRSPTTDQPPKAPPRAKRKQNCDQTVVVLRDWKLKQSVVVDLRDEPDSSPTSPVVKMLHKIDSSFSRSRSSSMSSLENISAEAIQCLTFAESYTRKTDSAMSPSLWVGTSLGSVLVILLTIPSTHDSRQTQPVIVSPSGTIFRLKGSILSVTFLDCNAALVPDLSESWKDREDKRSIKVQQSAVRDCSQRASRVSPTSSDARDNQLVVLASEKQARIVSLPSQSCLFKANLTETSFLVRAQVIAIKTTTESVCLACYIANGNIVVYSLPSLKPLVEVDFLPLIDMRIARTFCFSNNGHGMYLCSPSELQKFTISSAFCESLQEMHGTLFLVREMPEAPKQGFFKGLFGGGPSSLDRQELFGESSGKASKSVARHIPGNSNMEHVRAQTSSLGSEVMRARQGLTERGEHLTQLEERTAHMMSEAESFANASHQIMAKYRDKKWYQF